MKKYIHIDLKQNTQYIRTKHTYFFSHIAPICIYAKTKNLRMGFDILKTCVTAPELLAGTVVEEGEFTCNLACFGTAA